MLHMNQHVRGCPIDFLYPEWASWPVKCNKRDRVLNGVKVRLWKYSCLQRIVRGSLMCTESYWGVRVGERGVAPVCREFMFQLYTSVVKLAV